ncbi:MAG: hypothetical protein OHK0017_06330 [Patescibacteria group bacterium]
MTESTFARGLANNPRNLDYSDKNSEFSSAIKFLNARFARAERLIRDGRHLKVEQMIPLLNILLEKAIKDGFIHQSQIQFYRARITYLKAVTSFKCERVKEAYTLLESFNNKEKAELYWHSLSLAEISYLIKNHCNAQEYITNAIIHVDEAHHLDFYFRYQVNLTTLFEQDEVDSTERENLIGRTLSDILTALNTCPENMFRIRLDYLVCLCRLLLAFEDSNKVNQFLNKLVNQNFLLNQINVFKSKFESQANHSEQIKLKLIELDRLKNQIQRLYTLEVEENND